LECRLLRGVAKKNALNPSFNNHMSPGLFHGLPSLLALWRVVMLPPIVLFPCLISVGREEEIYLKKYHSLRMKSIQQDFKRGHLKLRILMD
jgi:hypothetical protein